MRTFLSGHLSVSVGSLNKQYSSRTEDAAFLTAAVRLIGCSLPGSPLDAFFFVIVGRKTRETSPFNWAPGDSTRKTS
jgi:hypothetical protein